MIRNFSMGFISIAIAALLFFHGVQSPAENILRLALNLVAAVFLLLMFNLIRTNIHNIFTLEQFTRVVQWFPDEVKNNRSKTIVWLACATTLAVLLIVGGIGSAQESNFSVGIMITAASWICVLATFLWINRRRVFTIKQIVMMKGSLDERIGTSRLKGLSIVQKGAKEGKVVSVDSLFDNLKSSTYRATKSEEELIAMENLEKEFREKYGDFMPVDEAYKITIRVEKGLDPFGSEGD